jgi:type I restriction enzyme S subunit
MEKNKGKVPKIRFPGFTDDWEQRKFENIATRASEMGSDLYLPRVEYEDIISGIGQLNKDVKLKESSKQGIKFTEGDVLYGKLRPYLYNWLLPAFSGLAVGDFWVLQPQNTDSEFLFRLVQSAKFDEIANQSTGTKMPRADWKLVSKTEFYIPLSIEEQRKIGAYFSTLDHLITLHQRKLTHLQAQKKGLLQKMFPTDGEQFPELRFPGFTGAWDVRKLGEIATDTYGGGTPKTSNTKYWDGCIPWIQSSDLIEHKLYGIVPRKYISECGLQNSATKLVPENSIAIVTRVGVGKLAFLPFSYATSQDFLSLSNLKIDTCFSVYAIYNKLQKELNTVQGTSIKGITKGELLFKDISVPENSEQKKIGQFFYNIDNLITLHQRKLTHLQQQKKALLQQMFV